jgi:hypothetical protein
LPTKSKGGLLNAKNTINIKPIFPHAAFLIQADATPIANQLKLPNSPLFPKKFYGMIFL